MVSACLLSLLALLPFSVLGSQVPVIDGTIGGVPKTVSDVLALPSIPAVKVGSLRVTENSGVCETTNGVYTASGYGDLGTNSHMWFWFFEARNNPATAPLAIWLNGGPGSSSMIGLFQEHGPCRIRNDSSGVDLNPSSWNEVANMLYIDQPVGVGFSYGAATVSSSIDAAHAVWNFLQIFFSDYRFAKYASHEFAFWTESYGGHYGPVMTSYFLDQNDAIANGTIKGIPLKLKVLGIGNGLTDPITQYPGYISYSQNNVYHPLVSMNVTTSANQSYYAPGGCRDEIVACNINDSNTICSQAQNDCNNNILSPLAGNYDVYYVPTLNPDPYPPSFATYINSQAVTSKIGAQSKWSETSFQIYQNFANTGDWMKTSKPQLERVINAGVRTVLYDGDADYICNHMGVEAMVSSLNTKFSSEYAAEPWTQWTVEGTVAGQYKNAGTFSYVRVYRAGHEVPAYTVGKLPTGLHALTMFTQVNAGLPIHST